jgi:GTP-binding protein Era
VLADVGLLGMPNAGKSTLYNHLLGEALAIVNPKAQTTRHRILGVKNGEGFQIVYSDTPGVLNKTSYKMHDKMMFFVNESIKDSDVLILMLDIKVRKKSFKTKKSHLYEVGFIYVFSIHFSRIPPRFNTIC